MYEATVDANYPVDELSRLFSWLVRMGGLYENHRLGEVSVSASEIFALGELTDGGVQTQQELAERLGLEKSTVSRLAAGLERRGWLARERDPGNRRFYRLALTKAGHQAAQHIGAHLREHHRAIMKHLTDQERQCLATGINGLMRAFQAARGET